MFDQSVFRLGMRDGIPIALGYLAVSFTLGIAARRAGLTPFQGFLASALNNASAGQYAGFVSIAAHASYFEIALATLIANARYLLMSFALSQRLSPQTPLRHRLLLGFYITDENFGITIARKGFVNPYYTYGAILLGAPAWALGTALGIAVGDVLHPRLLSALSVALYGMFLAIIIPPSRKNKTLAYVVFLSFAASLTASLLPLLRDLGEGTRTIWLTVIIASLAAVIRPVDDGPGEGENSDKTEHKDAGKTAGVSESEDSRHA